MNLYQNFLGLLNNNGEQAKIEYNKKDIKNIKNQDKDNDITNKILVVKKSRCPQNHVCPSVKVCPTGALSQNSFAAPSVDMDKCIRCGKCVKFCPKRVLNLE